MRDRVARRLHALLDVPAPALDEPLPLQPDVRLDHRLLLSDPNVITNKYCNKSDNKTTIPFGLGPLRVTLWVLVIFAVSIVHDRILLGMIATAPFHSMLKH